MRSFHLKRDATPFTSIALSLACLWLSSHSIVWAAEQEWQLVRSKDGIQIYSREQSLGLIEVQAELITSTSFDGFRRLLSDTQNANQWLSHVKQVTLLSAPSTEESIVHTKFSLPWPFSNRDMVTYSRYSQPKPEQLVLKIVEASDMLPNQPFLVRIQTIYASWQLEKLSETRTLIRYTAFADPGGNLPRWLVNKLAISGSFETLQGLKKRLPLYQ